MGDSLLKAKELFWLKGKNGFCKQWSCLNNKTSYNAHRIEIFVWPICSHIARSFHAYKAQFCYWYGIHNLAHKNDYNGISDFFSFFLQRWWNLDDTKEKYNCKTYHDKWRVVMSAINDEHICVCEQSLPCISMWIRISTIDGAQKQ